MKQYYEIEEVDNVDFYPLVPLIGEFKDEPSFHQAATELEAVLQSHTGTWGEVV